MAINRNKNVNSADTGRATLAYKKLTPRPATTRTSTDSSTLAYKKLTPRPATTRTSTDSSNRAYKKLSPAPKTSTRTPGPVRNRVREKK